MKYFILLFFLNLIYVFSQNCIPETNCLKSRGTCVNNICQCHYSFWTIPNYNIKNKQELFCNYDRINRIKPLLLEVFLPIGIGHFLVNNYKKGILKLILVLIPIIIIIVGYTRFKNSSNNQGISNEEEEKLLLNENDIEIKKDDNNDISEEGNDKVDLDVKLHKANHKQINLTFFDNFLIFIEGLCILGFLAMYAIDIIGYGFAIYYDGYNVPLL